MSIGEHNPDLLDVVSGHCLELIPDDDAAIHYDEHDDAADLGCLASELVAEPEPAEELTLAARRLIATAVKVAHAKWHGFPLPELVLADRPEPAAALVEVQLGNLMTAEIEPVLYAVERVLPRRHVTLLGGHGGIGKSGLALAICAHVACGRPFAGLATERLPALFVSLEDEPSIVMARLRCIIEAFGLEPGKVLPRLRLLDGTRGLAALMSAGEGFNAPPQFTLAFRELAESADGAGIIVIDNASDAFDANENVRSMVRAFVRGLAAIARKHDAAVCLLAHIDKAAARGGGQGNLYSGSTAWHNSARSRLALVEQDGAITLLHEKANLSARAAPIRLAFSAGGILVPESFTGAAALTGADFDQAEIIRVLTAAREAGIDVPVSLTPGAYSAMKALEPLPEYCQTFKGAAGGRRAAAALTALRRAGRVRSETYRTAQRKERERLVVARAES